MEEKTIYTGENLRKLVDASGIKLIKLAEKIGVDYVTLNRWFNTPEIKKTTFEKVLSKLNSIDYEAEYTRLLEENKSLKLEIMLLKSETKARQI